MDANHLASEGLEGSEGCGRESLCYLRQYTSYYQNVSRNMPIEDTFGSPSSSDGNKKHASGD